VADAVRMMEYITAIACAPMTLLLNSHPLRPVAKGRIALSAWPSSMGMFRHAGNGQGILSGYWHSPQHPADVHTPVFRAGNEFIKGIELPHVPSSSRLRRKNFAILRQKSFISSLKSRINYTYVSLWKAPKVQRFLSEKMSSLCKSAYVFLRQKLHEFHLNYNFLHIMAPEPSGIIHNVLSAKKVSGQHITHPEARGSSDSHRW